MNVNCEEVSLCAYRDGWESDSGLASFLWRYCYVRPHSSLGGKAPHKLYDEIDVLPSLQDISILVARGV